MGGPRSGRGGPSGFPGDAANALSDASSCAYSLVELLKCVCNFASPVLLMFDVSGPEIDTSSDCVFWLLRQLLLLSIILFLLTPGYGMHISLD